MKLTSIFILILLLLPFASAIGMGMPPAKDFYSFIGDEFYIDIVVLNEEASKGNYTINFEGSLRDRASASPSSMIINPPLNVPHRGNPLEDGFERVRISIDSEGLTPGSYDLSISASVTKTGESALNIIQRVTRKITVHYSYPPSFFSKAMNFIYTTSKKSFDWIIQKIKTFYENNRWLNYLFFTILLGIVFYIGAKARKIIRYFKREGEKISKYGFWSWFIKKIKDTFKKTKKKEFVELNGKNNGEKREDMGNSGN